MKVFTLLLVLASATAHADDTLPITVRGTIDAPALRARLADELGRSVMLVDECQAPCLEIAISRGRASVAYQPANGDARVRVVDLGSDRSQWPLVITLLAGNVVRDEAADLLAKLPPPKQPAPDPDPAPEPTPEPDPVSSESDGPAPEPDDQSELAPPSKPPLPSVRPRPLPSPEQRPQMALGFGFVPGLSTDWTHVGSVQHVLSIDLIAGFSGGSSMLTLSGVADIERGDVSGAQLAGVVAIARRVGGFQVAGVAAVAGDLTGVQVAGTAVIADRVTGFQVAGVATLARNGADTQIAGVAAVSRGRASLQVAGVATVSDGSANLQLAGVAAVSRGTANLQAAGVAVVSDGSSNFQVGGVAALTRGTANVQLAGVAAVAKGDSNFQAGGVASVAQDANVQLAGVVNVARRVRGMQIAPINVARHVEGVQVGVINVGGSADGFSFGLINIVPGGRADLEATVDSSKIGSLLFRHGGNRWHNVYGIAGHPVNEERTDEDVWMYGLGFGPSFRMNHTRIDVEAIGWQVNHGKAHSTNVSVLGQLRVTAAYGIGPFAIVGGAALNTYVSSDHSSPFLVERRAPGAEMDEKYTVEVWPSFFAGLRI